MTAVFADTSFFIAFLSDDDADHAAAKAAMSGLNRKVVTIQWVLTEVGNFLRKESQRGRFAPFVERLVASPYVTIYPADTASFNAGMKLYDDRPDKAWSLTDCISFVVMRDHKIQDALTTDHHFNQAGFNALLV